MCPEIPPQVKFFFRTLLEGISSPHTDKETVDQKIKALSSDAIYNVTRGSVKPWKPIVLGIDLASLTGSKLAMQMLNRSGHCISYSEIKDLETEFAYSVMNEDQVASNGIQLAPSLETACVYDNYDANIETLDGKNTLHATVGHTYQNIVQNDHLDTRSTNPIEFRENKNRRSFVGRKREIPPFRKSLKNAHFVSFQEASLRTSTRLTPVPGDPCTSAKASCL